MLQRFFGVAIGVALLAFSAGANAQQSAADETIKKSQLTLKLHPDDYKTYAALGSAYLQKGRESGDASDFELARSALNRSLESRSSDPFAAFTMTQMAVTYMAEHRFHDAYDWAERALGVGAGDPSPWAIVGDALADVGEYKEAAKAYERLVDGNGSSDEVRSIEYQRLSRLSYLDFIAGDTDASMKRMRNALEIAIDLNMPAENIAWSEYQLGEESFLGGDLKQAAKCYEDALEMYPGYYRALAGLAKARAAEGNLVAAEELYGKAIGAVPFPEYAAALGDLYRAEGKLAEAQKQYDLVEFIGHLSEINAEIHNRDLALFYADHGLKLDQAVALARRELELRQDIYTWDVLGWALFKHGDLKQAAEAMTHALSQGTKDAQLYFHAGMIHEGLGDREQARQYLERALAINPRFHVLHAEDARKALVRLKAVAAQSQLAQRPYAQQ